MASGTLLNYAVTNANYEQSVMYSLLVIVVLINNCEDKKYEAGAQGKSGTGLSCSQVYKSEVFRFCRLLRHADW
jgi:hypothetical protein